MDAVRHEFCSNNTLLKYYAAQYLEKARKYYES